MKASAEHRRKAVAIVAAVKRIKAILKRKRKAH